MTEADAGAWLRADHKAIIGCKLDFSREVEHRLPFSSDLIATLKRKVTATYLGAICVVSGVRRRGGVQVSDEGWPPVHFRYDPLH
jgi:hypothetical protein